MEIEFLWFENCPNHREARRLIDDVLADLGLDATIRTIKVADARTGKQVCFPGSPTIRVNGDDIEPGWEPCDDCTPRCRLYATPTGLRGLPERAWLEHAVRAAS